MTTPTRATSGINPGSSGTNNTSPRPVHVNRVRRLSTETKAAFKTTEFWVYIAMVIAVLIASMTVGSDSNATAGNSGDYFRADKAWLYITILTVGYMFSRGLAKAGSRDFYDREENDDQD